MWKYAFDLQVTIMHFKCRHQAENTIHISSN